MSTESPDADEFPPLIIAGIPLNIASDMTDEALPMAERYATPNTGPVGRKATPPTIGGTLSWSMPVSEFDETMAVEGATMARPGPEADIAGLPYVTAKPNATAKSVPV